MNKALWLDTDQLKRELGYCGENVRIYGPVIVTDPKQVRLGDHVRIDPFVMITTRLTVGQYCMIMGQAVFSGGTDQEIWMDGWNFVGYGSKLFTASEDYSGELGPVNADFTPNRIDRRDIRFERYSGIASNVMVMPGVEFPIGCTVGANSFVYRTEELAPWSVHIGNPLRFHKPRNSEKVIEVALEQEKVLG